jgi:REP element-mobilizing transposase RayT
MPDHVHAIASGLAAEASLPSMVTLLKQRSGYLFRRSTGRPLWQQSYFDRTLRVDQSLASVAAYVINNPIRAGLVADAMEYPPWGSCVCTREELLELVAQPGG